MSIKLRSLAHESTWCVRTWRVRSGPCQWGMPASEGKYRQANGRRSRWKAGGNSITGDKSKCNCGESDMTLTTGRRLGPEEQRPR